MMTSTRHRDWLFSFLILTLTVLAYLPAMRGDFIWDDNDHISGVEQLRSLYGLYEIWFVPGSTVQYYPLTFTGFWIGYQLWGLNTLGYHLMNALLHGITALLLWRLLRSLRMPGAWLAGLIFALHPVHVMSVAWMTELKNVLSGALFLGSAWAFVRFARIGVFDSPPSEVTPEVTPEIKPFSDRPSWGWYIAALVLFILAMFAKTAVSLLVLTLLLILWWRKPKARWTTWLSVLPFGLIAAGFGAMTIIVEKRHGATGDLYDLNYLEKILIAGKAFWFYTGKLLFPYPLTFIYYRWTVDVTDPIQYIWPALLIALIVLLWLARRKLGVGPLAAVIYSFVGSAGLILIHVIYMTRYTWVTDHWQYLGSMSLIALAAAGIVLGLQRLALWRQAAGHVLVALMLVTLGLLTLMQCRIYQNSGTLYQDTLRKNDQSSMVHNNYGGWLNDQADRIDPSWKNPQALELAQRARDHFEKALALDPRNDGAMRNLGGYYLMANDPAKALDYYLQALKINNQVDHLHHQIGQTLLRQGRYEESLPFFRNALRLSANDYYNKRRIPLPKNDKDLLLLSTNAAMHSDYARALELAGDTVQAQRHLDVALQLDSSLPDALTHRGNILASEGKLDQAIALYQQAIDQAPHLAEAHYNLGMVLMPKGQLVQAIHHLQRAVALKPSLHEARLALGLALTSQNRLDEALVQFLQCLQQQPNDPATHYNLGSLYLLMNQPQSGRSHYEQAIKLRPDYPEALDALANYFLHESNIPPSDLAKALPLASRACELTGRQHPHLLATLSLALARQGQFPQAIAVIQEAIPLATTLNQPKLAQSLQQMLSQYQAGKLP